MDAVKLRRSIGYVIQEGGLFPHWTVAENIATVLRLEDAPKEEIRETVLDLMERTGLPRSLADRYPGQLSEGQRQRVGVARALANKPLLMLMDEPFGALDPLVRRDLQNEMIRIRDEFGVTILLVTHDMSEAMRLGQKIVVMQEGGRIVQAGTPKEILEHPATLAAYTSDIGLGRFVFAGMKTNHFEEMIAGAILVMALTLVLGAIFKAFQRITETSMRGRGGTIEHESQT